MTTVVIGESCTSGERLRSPVIFENTGVSKRPPVAPGELFLILVGIALAAESANAQPIQTAFRTIEARVAQADHVAVGTIDKVSRKVIVAPGGRDKIGCIYPEGQFEYTVTLKIGEVLKGDLKGTVDDLGTIDTTYSDKRYEEWSQAQTTLLWFLGPTPKVGARRQWEILPLGKRVPAEDLFGRRNGGVAGAGVALDEAPGFRETLQPRPPDRRLGQSSASGF